MIAEVALCDIINPPEEVEEMTFFDELEDPTPMEEKSIDYVVSMGQTRGFKQGCNIVIEDKNINFSRRPGYLTIDLDRREEPMAAHSPFFDDKGEDLTDDIPAQRNN